MKRESYEKEFNTFQQNNIEAIDKYESTNICLDNSFDAIYKIINKSNILNVQQFLYDALVYANENMVDIVDACKSINETTSSISNTTTFYFNQVQNVYKKNGNIDISNVNHSETDPVKMVENNLKTVISIAKRYLNRGLSLDDLISAGNLGLCEAVNKYKDSKWKLRNAILMDMAGLNYVKPKKSKGDSFKDWDLFNQANMQPNGEYDHKLLKFRDFSLKELFSVDISSKYKLFDKEQNKRVITNILSQNAEKPEKHNLIAYFNLNYKETYSKLFLGKDTSILVKLGYYDLYFKSYPFNIALKKLSKKEDDDYIYKLCEIANSTFIEYFTKKKGRRPRQIKSYS